MKRHFPFLVVLSFLGVLAGCSSEANPPVATTPSASPSAVSSVSSPVVEATPNRPVTEHPTKSEQVQPSSPSSAPSGGVSTQSEKPGELAKISAETEPDPVLEAAILAELDGYSDCLTTDNSGLKYFYNWVDLNQDNNPEAIAYLVGSFSCGSGGCTTLVFTPSGNGLQLVSRITVSNPPIVVSNETTNGWKNLVFPVSGGGVEPGYHVLQFDGQHYPTNPSVAPKASNAELQGTQIIANEIQFDTPAPTLKSDDCP